MSELLRKRIIFTNMIPLLITKARQLDFNAAIDFVKRCEDCKVGSEVSLHKLGLAVDLNLYTQEGMWLKKTEDHQQLGEYWESIGGTWGGRWQDGNHYSLEYRGRK